jgi:hypothetical protein
MIRRPQVAFDQYGLASLLFDEGGYLFGVVAFIEVGDQDIGAFAGEGDGDRPADATVSAGDDGPSTCRRPEPLYVVSP